MYVFICNELVLLTNITLLIIIIIAKLIPINFL